jgi:hypothetical protein
MYVKEIEDLVAFRPGHKKIIMEPFHASFDRTSPSYRRVDALCGWSELSCYVAAVVLPGQVQYLGIGVLQS